MEIDSIIANRRKVDWYITLREQEVFALICQGFSNKEIAQKLVISEATVNHHVSSMLMKTSSKNRAHLVFNCLDLPQDEKIGIFTKQSIES